MTLSCKVCNGGDRFESAPVDEQGLPHRLKDGERAPNARSVSFVTARANYQDYAEVKKTFILSPCGLV
jgi:hypothetical protein